MSLWLARSQAPAPAEQRHLHSDREKEEPRDSESCCHLTRRQVRSRRRCHFRNKSSPCLHPLLSSISWLHEAMCLASKAPGQRQESGKPPKWNSPLVSSCSG